MKGWLIPLVTGDYVFWIVEDDSWELWLSSDDNPEYKVLVCFLSAETEAGKWTGYHEQELTLTPLVAGKAYYI